MGEMLIRGQEYRDLVGHRISQVYEVSILALHPGVLVVFAEEITGVAYPAVRDQYGRVQGLGNIKEPSEELIPVGVGHDLTGELSQNGQGNAHLIIKIVEMLEYLPVLKVFNR